MSFIIYFCTSKINNFLSFYFYFLILSIIGTISFRNIIKVSNFIIKNNMYHLPLIKLKLIYLKEIKV